MELLVLLTPTPLMILVVKLEHIGLSANRCKMFDRIRHVYISMALISPINGNSMMFRHPAFPSSTLFHLQSVGSPARLLSLLKRLHALLLACHFPPPTFPVASAPPPVSSAPPPVP